MAFSERVLEFEAVRELLAERCISEMGRRRVAAMGPVSDRAQLSDAIALVREMMELFATRREPPIQGMRDCAKHLARVRRERAILEPAELLELKDFCETAGQTRRHFEPLQTEVPGLHALAMPLHGVPALVRSIDEKIAPNATVRDTASELLAHLRAEIFMTEKAIQETLNHMVRSLTDSGDLQDNFWTLRNERYVLPVKSSNRGKVPGIIHDSSNTGETVFIEPFAILEQTNRLADLRLREREEVYRILLRIAGHIRDEINALLTNQEILTEFDFLWCKARFGIEFRGTFPALTGMERPLHLAEAHHPLLFAANPENSRPLNLTLDPSDRVLVITGPNAGGKTTALKTVGLTALLVQSAVPVPIGASSRMPVFENVLANIGDEQDLLEGYSTFSAHMARIADILKKTSGPTLVLLDELGTATDPGEGAALAIAILETLAERGALTLVTSHLGALKNWAFTHPRGRNASFRLSESDRRPTFRLTMDLPGISEAFVIAEQVGLPSEVLERAKALRPQGEEQTTALLLSLQEKEERLAQELAEARRARAELEARLKENEQLNARLREEKKQFRLRMIADRDRVLAEMRSRVEQFLAAQPTREELLEARREIDRERTASHEEREQIRRGMETAAALSGEVQAGDRVMIMSLNEPGTVQEILTRKGEARVTVGRITATVKLSDLKLVARAEPPRPKETETPARGVHFRRPESPESTLDLHGCRVEEALEKFEKFLDQALLAGFSSARVMHGQGSGTLARALHQHFRRHPALKSYRYAEPHEGGGGVTIVEFK